MGDEGGTLEEYGLTIEYRGSESVHGYKTEFLSFSASVTKRGFAGETEFEVPEAGIQEFIRDLLSFYDNLKGAAPRLRCGWGDTVYFGLDLSLYNPRGAILMECQVRKPYVNGLFDSVVVYQLVEVQQVQELAHFLEQIIAFKAPLSIQIKFVA